MSLIGRERLGLGLRPRTGPGVRTGVAGDDGAAALNTLLTGGAQFLMNLSKVLAQPPQAQQEDAASAVDASQPVQTGLQAMIGRDMTTGKTYLKIPLPEAEAMDQIVSGLGQLLAGLMRVNNQVPSSLKPFSRNNLRQASTTSAS